MRVRVFVCVCVWMFMYIGSIDAPWSMTNRRFRLPHSDITSAAHGPGRQGAGPTISVALAT